MKNKKTITIFDGKQFKTIAFESVEDWEAWIAGKDVSNDPYISSAWYYSNVRKRASMSKAVPRILTNISGNTELEEKELPFLIDIADLISRSSIALDRYAAAYWGKIRSGNTLVKVRWLDPTTIDPIYDSAGAGLMYFQRSVGGEQRQYPYDKDTDMSPDLGWVWLLGMNEAGPGIAPEHVAKLPANILASGDKVIRDHYERGAISQHWITAKHNPVKAEKERLLAKIRRVLFGGVDTSHAVEIFNEAQGLTIQKIGSNPDEFYVEAIDESNKVDVGAVLETPRLIINPDSAANRSMLDRTWSSWIDYTIVPHTQMIVNALNYHILEPNGYTLKLNPHAMTISQEEERQRAQAWMLYVSQGANPKTAAAMLGLDVPEGMKLMADEPPINVQRPNITPEQEEQEEARDESEKESDKIMALAQLGRWVKHGNHLKRPFQSDILTKQEIADVIYAANIGKPSLSDEEKRQAIEEVGKAQDAPFRPREVGDWESYP
jgi:hypothetical protein